MIIGITGKNGSGKGEVAKFLVDSGYVYFSLSDMLREELASRGQDASRENLISVGNELRTKYGSGVLAERTLRKIGVDEHAVVDSVRNPFEVEALRRRKDFFLVSVETDAEVRFKRTLARNRDGDSKTLESFLDVERREAQSADPATQQMDRTANMADAVICNNGSIDELHEEIREVVKALAANMKRPDWDEYFMNIAKVVSLRGNCIKRKVAAVIVKDKRIISTGYNGTPRGITNCTEGGCPRCHCFGKSGEGLGECFCSHAEENSIVQAAYHGVSIKGGTLYTTFSPCLICTKMILNSGLVEVVYNKAYSIGEVPMKLLKEAGITVRQIEI